MDTLGDITLVLGKNSRGTYSDGKNKVNFDYAITQDERHLIFSNKDIWDNDAFYGTFNEEASRTAYTWRKLTERERISLLSLVVTHKVILLEFLKSVFPY